MFLAPSHSFRRTSLGTTVGLVLLGLVLCGTEVAGAADTPAADAPVVVTATAEPREVRLGDPIRYVVEIAAAPDTETYIPLLSGAIGDFQIVDFGENPPRDENGKHIISRWYTLTCFATGDKLIPAPTVAYRLPGAELTELTGNEVLIGITSLLAKEPEAKDIRDIKPPEPIPFDWTPYLILAGLIAVAIAVIALLYFLLNRPRRLRSAPPPPAHEVALAALESLRRRRLIEDGQLAEFFVGLTHVVRVYLENGFHLRAPEMTTEEFLAAASADRRLAAQHRRLLGDFLTQADLVKFARLLPSPKDADAAFEAARRFVEDTRPSPTVSVEERDRAAA